MIDERKYSDGDAKGTRRAKDLPCFQFARNGKCRFGDKCKYSHTPSKEVALTLAEALSQYSERENELVEQINILQHSRNTWKKKYADRVRNSSSRPGNSRQTGQKTKFYEDAIESAEKANVAETLAPEKPNDPEDDLYDTDTDSDNSL